MEKFAFGSRIRIFAVGFRSLSTCATIEIRSYGPGGQRVAFVDDISATNTDAILQVALAEGIGEYRVEAYGYALMPGTFTLRLRTQ